jgi:hypothetical protein
VIIVAVLVRCRAYAATNCGEAAALRNVRGRSGSQRAPMDGMVGNGKIGIPGAECRRQVVVEGSSAYLAAAGVRLQSEATVAFHHNQDDLPTVRFGAKLVRQTDSPLRPTRGLSSIESDTGGESVGWWSSASRATVPPATIRQEELAAWLRGLISPPVSKVRKSQFRAITDRVRVGRVRTTS